MAKPVERTFRLNVEVNNVADKAKQIRDVVKEIGTLKKISKDAIELEYDASKFPQVVKALKEIQRVLDSKLVFDISGVDEQIDKLKTKSKEIKEALSVKNMTKPKKAEYFSNLIKDIDVSEKKIDSLEKKIEKMLTEEYRSQGKRIDTVSFETRLAKLKEEYKTEMLLDGVRKDALKTIDAITKKDKDWKRNEDNVLAVAEALKKVALINERIAKSDASKYTGLESVSKTPAGQSMSKLYSSLDADIKNITGAIDKQIKSLQAQKKEMTQVGEAADLIVKNLSQATENIKNNVDGSIGELGKQASEAEKEVERLTQSVKKYYDAVNTPTKNQRNPLTGQYKETPKDQRTRIAEYNNYSKGAAKLAEAEEIVAATKAQLQTQQELNKSLSEYKNKLKEAKVEAGRVAEQLRADSTIGEISKFDVKLDGLEKSISIYERIVANIEAAIAKTKLEAEAEKEVAKAAEKTAKAKEKKQKAAPKQEEKEKEIVEAQKTVASNAKVSFDGSSGNHIEIGSGANIKASNISGNKITIASNAFGGLDVDTLQKALQTAKEIRDLIDNPGAANFTEKAEAKPKTKVKVAVEPVIDTAALRKSVNEVVKEQQNIINAEKEKWAIRLPAIATLEQAENINETVNNILSASVAITAASELSIDGVNKRISVAAKALEKFKKEVSDITDGITEVNDKVSKASKSKTKSKATKEKEAVEKVAIDFDEQRMINSLGQTIAQVVRTINSEIKSNGQSAGIAINIPVRTGEIDKARVGQRILGIQEELNKMGVRLTIPFDLFSKDVGSAKIAQARKGIQDKIANGNIVIKWPSQIADITKKEIDRAITAINAKIKENGRKVGFEAKINLSKKYSENVDQISAALKSVEAGFTHTKEVINSFGSSGLESLTPLRNIVKEIADELKRVKEAKITVTQRTASSGSKKSGASNEKNEQKEIERSIKKNQGEIDKLLIKLAEYEERMKHLSSTDGIDVIDSANAKMAQETIDNIKMSIDSISGKGFVDSAAVLKAKQDLSALGVQVKEAEKDFRKAEKSFDSMAKMMESAIGDSSAQNISRVLKAVGQFISSAPMRYVSDDNLGLSYFGSEEQLAKIRAARDEIKSLYAEVQTAARMIHEAGGTFDNETADKFITEFAKRFGELDRLTRRVGKRPIFGEHTELIKTNEELDKVKQRILEIENVTKHKNLIWDVKTTGDVSKLSAEFVDQEGKLRRLVYQYDAASGGLKNLNTSEKTTLTLMQRLNRLFQQRGEALVAYIGTFASFYRVMSSFRQGFEIIKTLDTNMTELRRVSGATESALQSFKSTVFETGREVGTTADNIIKLAADYARLGYTLNEASELAKSTAMYMNVGFIDDANFAMESLTSTMKAYGMQASEVTSIVDKFNEVGNNFSISSQGIGEALQRSAAALAQANNDLDQSIALVTAANNVVQDPQVVGTALRTVAMRIRGAKSELED